MSLLDVLLEGSEQFRSTYIKYAERLPDKPRKKLAILTCIDTRLIPIRIFHINIGDALILRNAGNKVTDDVIRSLVVGIANEVTEIVILGHTDCALTKISRQKVSSALQKLGGTLGLTAQITFNEWIGTFSDEELNVKNQVELLRSSSMIPSTIPIHGLLFNVVDGTIKVVVNGYEMLKQPKSGVKSIGLTITMPDLKMPPIDLGSLFTSLSKSRDLHPEK
ncbi:MAG TPA: carbonic anhydrase [Candidatus Deferrimicrobium sp.]|nr:carbonic anhydrase [Candidatus Deferrimicrobium sp.]